MPVPRNSIVKVFFGDKGVSGTKVAQNRLENMAVSSVSIWTYSALRQLYGVMNTLQIQEAAMTNHVVESQETLMSGIGDVCVGFPRGAADRASDGATVDERHDGTIYVTGTGCTILIPGP